MNAINIKKLIPFALAILLVGGSIFIIRSVSDLAARPKDINQSPSLLTSNLTFADRMIREAEAVIQQSQSDPKGYNLLCSGYLQKARETSDFGFNAKAEAALTRSFEVAPDNYDAIKLKAILLLAHHRFQETLEVARHAQQLRPKDNSIYGPLTDALVELGDYKAAIEAAETMMDLRPDVASYTRISYLRALHGNTEGAIEVMRTAVKSASVGEPETLAWCRVHLGQDLINLGRINEAEREFDLSLAALPGYHLALAGKASARLAAGDFQSAIEIYKQAQDRVPLPDVAIALGDLYTKTGQIDDARRQYEFAEYIEKVGAAGAGTYSRQMALFWANHDTRLDEALAIAQRERQSRADIYTCDTLAWCLFKKGEFNNARAAIQDALRLGTRDAMIHYHAGMIFKALGDRQSSIKHLKLALQINPAFDVLQAEVAKQTINTE